MKVSARNVLKGKIVDVVEGATSAHVADQGGQRGRHGVNHQRSGR